MEYECYKNNPACEYYHGGKCQILVDIDRLNLMLKLVCGGKPKRKRKVKKKELKPRIT